MHAGRGTAARGLESETVSALQRWGSRLAGLVNVVPLVVFRGLNGGMPLLLGLFIGHRWGLPLLGAYTWASAFAAVGLMVVDCGCTRWLPRELALVLLREGKGNAVATTNTVRLIIATLFLILTLLLQVVGHLSTDTVRFALELAMLYPLSIFSVNGISDRIVRREFGGIGTAVAAGLATFATLAWITLQAALGPHALVLAHIVGKAVETLLLMRGRLHLFRFARTHAIATLVTLTPFSVQAVLAVIYSRLSVFIVEHLRHADLGLVGAATVLQNVLLIAPISIALLTYPVLTTAAARGDMRRVRASLMTAAALSVAGVSTGLAALVALRGVVSSMLHISPSSIPFVIAFAAIAFLTIGSSLSGILLQSLGKERTVARLSFITLTAALALQYLFVRGMGLWGVAAGIVAAEMLSLIVFGTAAWLVISGAVSSTSGHDGQRRTSLEIRPRVH